MAADHHFHELTSRIRARTARVGVIGLGYAGLPLVRAVAEAGFATLGLDIDPAKVGALNAGRSYLRHIPDAAIDALRRGAFEASTEFARVGELDVVLICVPTPLGQHRDPDLRYVIRTAETIAPHLRPGQLVVLESTTYPGTTTEVLKPILMSSGLSAGTQFFLAYSPEREDPGNTEFASAMIPKVIGGDGAAAQELASAFYGQFVRDLVPVSSPAVAEAVKLTENIFRAVNIALVNELKLVYEAMDIDVWEVIDAAKTKPFGYLPFYPGPGLGGHCIPIDPFYLTWKAREHGLAPKFIELAGEINTAMPGHVIQRLLEALDLRFGKGLNGSRILVMGVAYKKNVEDVRESPALAIIQQLEARGADVLYFDPYVATIPPTRARGSLAGRRALDLATTDLADFDAVLIVTDHDGIDYDALVAGARLVVDTRNATHAVQGGREKIVKA